MKKKWEPKEVIHDFSTMTHDEYQLILEQFAELIYRNFCQLPKDEPIAQVLTSQVKERTMTYG
jgi:hypothetical protein